MPRNNRDTSIITFDIKVDGSVISDTYQVLGITVSHEINRIPQAEIILRDGDAATGDFAASSGNDFVPGRKLEILLGYANDNKLVFSGVVVRQAIRVRAGSSRLYVDCRDAAYALTDTRRSRYFEEMTDSEAIESILDAYAGLTHEVEATSVKHQELVQYRATDWDFILSRADANGLISLVESGKLTLRKPNLGASAQVQAEYGNTLFELDTELDGRSQYAGVNAYGWNPADQAVDEAEASEPPYTGPGNLDADTLSADLGMATLELRHGGHTKANELQAWADARLQHARLARVKGRAKIQGEPDLKPGDMLGLAGVGDRFNGDAFVSGVTHQLNDGQWFTLVRLGWDNHWFVEQFERIHDEPAAAMLPAVRGLQIGVVTALENDPEGEDRVKVRLPLLDNQSEGIWTRQANPAAGDGHGYWFRPEIGDEVVVGFLNEDPRDPILLGGLYSSAKPAPEPAKDDNHRKGYLSKAGSKLTFDDEKKSIQLETPGGAVVLLDDDAGLVSLTDQNGNKVVLDSSGITLESAKDLVLKATGDIKVEGVNVKLAGQASFAAEGGGSAKVSASGVMEISGSLVKIN